MLEKGKLHVVKLLVERQRYIICVKVGMFIIVSSE